MIIAVPSVTSYINNSRKSGYVTTAKNLMDAARTKVNEGKLSVYDTNTTYYIPTTCLNIENGEKAKSPYGNFTNAYIVVTYNGDGYNYYWTSTDETKTGVKTITEYNSLSSSSIESGVDNTDIKTNIGIDGRENVVIYNEDCTNSSQIVASAQIDSKTGTVEEKKTIELISQKTEGVLSAGDELVIGGKEHFYVIATDSSKTTLIAKYNLYVGYNVKQAPSGSGTVLDVKIPETDSRYGWQSAETEYNYNIALVPFSGKKYWQSTINENLFDSKYPDANDESMYEKALSTVAPIIENTTNEYGFSVPKVVDGNYSIAYYVEQYVNKLRSMGVHIDEGNVISHSQALAVGCGYSKTCSSSWMSNTRFWTGSVAWMGQAKYQNQVVSIQGSYTFSEYNSVISGVRPTITIRTSDITLLGHDYFDNKPIIIR